MMTNERVLGKDLMHTLEDRKLDTLLCRITAVEIRPHFLNYLFAATIFSWLKTFDFGC